MARFAIKALVVTALVCFVFDLAASDDSHQHHELDHQQTIGHETADKETQTTTPSSGTFKDKFKGFVSSVKEGASDVIDKLDEKRKEAVAGTKKLVQKIKHSYDSYRNDNSKEDEPREPGLVLEQAKDATIDKTKDFAKSEQFNGRPVA